jgi:hypothetical protein
LSFLEFFCGETLHLFFKKDSRLGLRRLGFAAFLNQNFILISKTTRDWDCFASLMIPFLAKNSRLGYFLNARNLHGE